MELRVNEVAIPEKIDFNYEELKAELTSKVSFYETLVYTDDQIKDAKADKANLNKLKRALNDERIRREKEYMQPFNVFKAQINEIIGIIDNTPLIAPLQVANDEPKTKRVRKTKEDSIQILDRLILNYSMSDFLLEKVREWIEYKVARKEDYVEQGMKSLLTKISKEAQKNGDAAVVDVIDLSMGNSYKGILWDKISKNNNQQPFSRNGERDILNEWRSS